MNTHHNNKRLDPSTLRPLYLRGDDHTAERRLLAEWMIDQILERGELPRRDVLRHVSREYGREFLAGERPTRVSPAVLRQFRGLIKRQKLSIRRVPSEDKWVLQESIPKVDVSEWNFE